MIAAAAYAARGMELPFSMGLRPRLSAGAARPRLSDCGLRGSGDGAAAFAAYSNPGLAPGDYSMNPVPLGIVFVFSILQRYLGEPSGYRLRWACLGSNTRDDCCRRLRGSGDGAIGFHGLTPTAKCGRRIRGSTRTPGLAPGDYLFKNSFPPRSVVILGRAVKPRLAWLTRGNVPYRSSL